MKRGLAWPIGMATILALTVGATIWVAVIANDDPSFAIEPDYYRKAIGWDSTMVQMRENARLRWHIQPVLDPFTRSGATLRLRLSDDSGAPIRDAKIRVAAPPTTYALQLPVGTRGEWELRFDIQRGGERFTSTTRLEAVAADGTP